MANLRFFQVFYHKNDPIEGLWHRQEQDGMIVQTIHERDLKFPSSFRSCRPVFVPRR